MEQELNTFELSQEEKKTIENYNEDKSVKEDEK